MCVCQVSTEGTSSSCQTGHSDNGQKCSNFTFTSANDSSSHALQNLEKCRHLREHYKYTCRYCESEFKYRNQLLHHVKTMHLGRQFACRQCQRSYVSISGLNEHVNKMHKQLSRYRCETCGKGFMDRSRYYDHIAAHTGVKQYTCSICEKRFMNNGSFRKHVLHFHPNEAAHIV